MGEELGRLSAFATRRLSPSSCLVRGGAFSFFFFFFPFLRAGDYGGITRRRCAGEDVDRGDPSPPFCGRGVLGRSRRGDPFFWGGGRSNSRTSRPLFFVSRHEGAQPGVVSFLSPSPPRGTQAGEGFSLFFPLLRREEVGSRFAKPARSNLFWERNTCCARVAGGVSLFFFSPPFPPLSPSSFCVKKRRRR